MNNITDRLEWFRNRISLENREYPVGIKAFRLDNRDLVKHGVRSVNEMENWSDFFEIEDGHFKEWPYISQVLSVFFKSVDFHRSNSDDPCYELGRKNSEYLCKIQKTFNQDGDWIIYTPAKNNIHTILKQMLTKIVDNKYEIVILDGGDDDRNGMRNDNCEEIAKEISEFARTNSKKVIFISSFMGIRSWSNKYVKNILFMFNGCSDDVLLQRIGRGLTPLNKETYCCIYDIRLDRDSSNISQWLAASYKQKQENNEMTIDVFVEGVKSTPKIELYDAYKDEENYLTELDLNGIKNMMFTNDFTKHQINRYIDFDLISEPTKTISNIKFKAPSENNVKGDHEKKEKVIRKKINSGKKDGSKEDVSIKVKYLEYIYACGKELNYKMFTENIVNNICEYIENNKEEYRDYIENYLELDFDTIYDFLKQFKLSGINTDNIFVHQ